jgi:predicted kinase
MAGGDGMTVTARVGATTVLVNGLPGAGKSTLARPLACALGLPLFSKDTIKEAHADVLGSQPPFDWPQRRWNSALGAAASQTMWVLLANAPGGAVLESYWPTDVRHFVVAGLRRAGRPTALEIWCEVPLEIARDRFERRHPRHPIHGDLPAGTDWQRWRQYAQPLGIGPILRVDTSFPVDTDAVAAWIREHASTPDARSMPVDEPGGDPDRYPPSARP